MSLIFANIWSWTSLTNILIWQDILKGRFLAKKVRYQKLTIRRKRNLFVSDLLPKKFQKVLMKIEEIANVFLNSANFALHVLFTLAPPSGYALNLKTLIKLSKVSWSSKFPYEILRSSFVRKFDRTNIISPKRTPPKSPHRLGLIAHKVV